MTIMRGGKDVTDDKQRDALFGILTKAILEIEEIPVPWLDDCIENTRSAVAELRDRIPHE